MSFNVTRTMDGTRVGYRDDKGMEFGFTIVAHDLSCTVGVGDEGQDLNWSLPMSLSDARTVWACVTGVDLMTIVASWDKQNLPVTVGCSCETCIKNRDTPSPLPELEPVKMGGRLSYLN